MNTGLGLLGLLFVGAYEKRYYSRAQVFKRQREKEQKEHEDLVRRKRLEGIIINPITGIDQHGKKYWGESRYSVERERMGG